ncbi:MAG: hypothetical protein HKN37_11245 [Rhodothermales bacterium]|nr:hypothetical protein [Rhodothermales bacterium]
MVNKEVVKKDLIERIEALVEESCTLVRTKESWTRHVEIQAEIMQLCRKASDTINTDSRPYWDKDVANSRETRAA